MDEYITKENAQLARPEWRCRNDQYDCGWNDCINEYLDMIDTIPAADVVPIVHAQWIEKYWTTEDDWGVFNHHTLTCSACAEEYQWSRGKTNYCPNCGAKMDGKDRKDG